MNCWKIKLGKFTWRSVCLLVVGSGVGGCAPASRPVTPIPGKPQVVQGPDMPVMDLPTNKSAIEPIDDMEPSANRLQDLVGALLLYYNRNHRMSAALEELAPFAFSGPLKLTSPKSGNPYVYIRDGLGAPGQDIRIYIYDPNLARNGLRWCAVINVNAPPDSAYAINLPENKFRQFLPSPSQSPIR